MTNILALLLAIGAATAPMPSGDVKSGVESWRRGDYRGAIETWRPLAIAGDSDAQFNLGQAYKLGRGVPVDPIMAESWFRQAALQGHHQAEDNYGLALFQAGKRTEALPWLEKSVARGEPRAQLVLGTMLFNGDGANRDVPRAYALMTRASAAGLLSAQKTLAEMDAYISPVDRERGTNLAQQYAAQANAPGPREARQTVKIIEKNARPAGPALTGEISPTLPQPNKPVAVPRATPVQNWRIQLGAFSTGANARKQWAVVRDRLTGAQPSYVSTGTVTRLQAGPYADAAEARHACQASHTDCMILKPSSR